jgi:hypothetical protein
MLHAMPVQNCLHFLMPVRLDEWKSYDVPGVIGILRRRASGQFELLEAFACESVPSSRELATDERFAQWLEAAGGATELRFDVFLMPRSAADHRSRVVALLERSCGFRAPATTVSYVNAA